MPTPVTLARCRIGFMLGFISLTSLFALPDYCRRLTVRSAGAQFDQATNNITIHAAGRGNPWIKLGDGVDMPIDYSQASALKQLSDQGQISPLALASADFDEDGTPDLISGYNSTSGGFLTLVRGNVDSIYPNSPEAQQRKARGEFSDQSFLSPARTFELPRMPDFVAAGDFDADGHWDVVTAARDDNALYLLAGDGHGNFAPARRVELPGRVSTLTTGEVNRADGLTDVVVGIVSAAGPKALVFDSPDGALRGQAEEFDLPAEATAIATGTLDEDYTPDIAIAAGSELVVIYGRDRKLSLDEQRQAEVPEAGISRRSFPFALKAMAIGDFKGDHKTGLSLLASDGSVHLLSPAATKSKKKKKSSGIETWTDEILATGSWQHATSMISARVSSTPADDLVIVDPQNRQLHIFAGGGDSSAQASSLQPVSLDVDSEPVAVLPMRLGGYALSDLVVLRRGAITPSSVVHIASVFGVTNANDAGANSLRQAIISANINPGLDQITFAIGVGPQTINLLSPLPAITDVVVIDGTTQPGFAGSPIIELNGAGAGGAANGLGIVAGNSTVRGLVINRFSSTGIAVSAAGGDVIQGNFIGTNLAGASALANALPGVQISGSPNNLIGGTVAGARNILSGNGGEGVRIIGGGATGNQVQGNFIGTNASGTASIANAVAGVFITAGANGNTIGGTAPGAGNLLSGGADRGLNISADGNVAQGNLIGTTASGTSALGNAIGGVLVVGSNNAIGGTVPFARNVISGNPGVGFQIAGAGTSNNVVQGNFIGTNANGTADLGNSSDGLLISAGATNNTIGGTTAGARNVISGNDIHGLQIASAGTSNNVVQGNFIGTDVNGTADLGNSNVGLLISAGATNNTIGGTTAGARNVISGNDIIGLQIANTGTTNNVVQGNFIGTNASGTGGLGNSFQGVLISLGASNNTIGGTVAGALNVISGNGNDGFRIDDAGSSNNVLQGNFIGADANGAALGNGRGVSIIGASNNTIGGLSSNAGNVIAFNNQNGVRVTGGTGNAILSNSIFSNLLLGIDLDDNGVTPNDPGDGDTGGNNRQNFPVLTSVDNSFGGTIIQGSLNSTPNTTFTLQFFSNASCGASGFGEGQQLIGTRTVATDSNGNTGINFNLAGTFSPPITATATDPAGNTSEFSACVINAAALDLAVALSAVPNPVMPGGSLTYTITATNKGPVIVDNVTVADTLPDSVAFVSCSSIGGGTCLGSGNDRRVGFGALQPGTSATITLVTRVNNAIANGTIISDTATITSAGTDANPADNVAITSVTVATNSISINCPANVRADAVQGQTSAVMSYPPPTLPGNPAGVTVVCAPPSGSTFPVGTTTVTCTASDAANNKGSCGFTVTVGPFVPNNPSTDKPSIDFGNPINLPNQNPPSGTFAITNTGTAPVDVILASIRRTGGDVTSGKITNTDDAGFFTVFVINADQSQTQIAPGVNVTIPVGQRNFRVVFTPVIPSVAARTTNLSANQVLPEVVTSAVAFTTGDGRTLTINLTGRVASALRLIDPTNASRPPVVTFSKSGNQFTLTYSVFDSNLDVSRTSHQFVDSSGQPVGQALEVDLAQALQPLGLTRGQSFTVEQPFSGASSHPEIAGVRLTVFDGETSVSATASLGASTASVRMGDRAKGVTLVPPKLRLDGLTP